MDRVRFMVFKYTFNNISVISWWSVLLVEETRVPGENYTGYDLIRLILNTISFSCSMVWIK
jgi:hypothetical protein